MGSILDDFDKMLALMGEEEGDTQQNAEPCRICETTTGGRVAVVHNSNGDCRFLVCLSCGEHLMEVMEQIRAVRAELANNQPATADEAMLMSAIQGFLETDWLCKFCEQEVDFALVDLVEPLPPE